MINEPPPITDTDTLARWHHIELYVAGVHKLPEHNNQLTIAAAVDQVARLYQTPNDWDWIHPIDGRYCAMKKLGDAKLAIFRGSVTVHDWLDDFEAIQISELGAKVSKGFWDESNQLNYLWINN